MHKYFPILSVYPGHTRRCGSEGSATLDILLTLQIEIVFVFSSISDMRNCYQYPQDYCNALRNIKCHEIIGSIISGRKEVIFLKEVNNLHFRTHNSSVVSSEGFSITRLVSPEF